MGATLSVLGLKMPFFLYLRSAMVRFTLSFCSFGIGGIVGMMEGMVVGVM